MSRGGDRRAAAEASGKKVGRPAKPVIDLSAPKGMATEVLASIPEQEYWRGLLRADLTLLERTQLALGEKHLIKDTLVYLTDRRDGKPAQGVFVGDTREIARELDFGDLPLLTAGEPGAPGKPN